MRRAAQVIAVVAFAIAVVAPAAAQPFPNRTIEVVVSYAAGGSTDFVARALAQRLQERLGQSAVVLNKPGAAGTLGATYVARAHPDGHTLYVGFTTEMAVVPQLSKNAKYTLDDFEPIAVTGIVPVMMIVSKNVRANTLSELIEEVRRAPGKYTYGGGPGSPSHIMGAWLNRLRGLDVTHIPYRGGAQAVADVAGGHIDMFYAGVAAGKSAVDSGLIKALAVTGDARSGALPNVPTFKEAGLADFELASWNVFLAPKGTPVETVALLKREAAAALADPAIRATLAAQGVEPAPSQDVRAFLAEERQKFGRVVRALNIKLEP
jgi:tripartite-type tricarboxylate transporter receptor subunit TctC